MNRSLICSLLAALAVVSLAGCASSDAAWKHQSFAFSAPEDEAPAPAGTNLVALAKVDVSPLYRSRGFTYRLANDAYEQDPYASFFVAPERALAGAIRSWMRHDGKFGRVIEADGALLPGIVVEASVEELCGDLHDPAAPMGVMAIHFLIYKSTSDGPGTILLDEACVRQSPMSKRTPAALMAAWDVDLREIMEQLNSDYAKAHPDDR